MCCSLRWGLITELYKILFIIIWCIWVSDSDFPLTSLGQSWGSKFWWKSTVIGLFGRFGSSSESLGGFLLLWGCFSISGFAFSSGLSFSFGGFFGFSNLSLILTNISVLGFLEFEFGIGDLSFHNHLIVVFLFSSVNPESSFQLLLNSLN